MWDKSQGWTITGKTGINIQTKLSAIFILLTRF